VFIHGRAAAASFRGEKNGEACLHSEQQNLLKSKHSHHNVGFLPKAASLFNIIPLGATRFFCVHSDSKTAFWILDQPEKRISCTEWFRATIWRSMPNY
jgi:hypothetical protein